MTKMLIKGFGDLSKAVANCPARESAVLATAATWLMAISTATAEAATMILLRQEQLGTS